MMFLLKTKFGWIETVVNRPEGHVGGPIEYPNMEKLRQRLSDRIDRVRQCLNLGKTGECSEGCARERIISCSLGQAHAMSRQVVASYGAPLPILMVLKRLLDAGPHPQTASRY